MVALGPNHGRFICMSFEAADPFCRRDQTSKAASWAIDYYVDHADIWYQPAEGKHWGLMQVKKKDKWTTDPLALVIGPVLSGSDAIDSGKAQQDITSVQISGCRLLSAAEIAQSGNGNSNVSVALLQ